MTQSETIIINAVANLLRATLGHDISARKADEIVTQAITILESIQSKAQ